MQTPDELSLGVFRNRLMRLIESFGHSNFTVGQCNMINSAPAFDEVGRMAKANAEYTIDQIHEILEEVVEVKP